MKKVNPRDSAVHEHDAFERNRMGLDRLIFFSDAVFAIAITVLVLDIRLPPGGDIANNQQLLRMLIGLWPKYLAYFISFWVIGLYWISHHRKFLVIRRADSRLLRLNLLLLMLIAFMPFPTSVMSQNGSRTATVFYALVMALGGLLLALLWWHAAHNHHLVDPQLDKRFIRQEVVTPLATVAVFLISIGIAFLDQGLARLLWLLLIPVSLFLGARREAA
jgi:uncharacterized membrane protein